MCAASDVERWLSEYGRAWESKEPDRFVTLFAEDVRYFWTPLEKPKQGRSAVGRAFEAAIAHQEAIQFAASVVGVFGRRAIAHWQCSFRRPGRDRDVHLDGVFMIDFDEDGNCDVFREWWHSDENDETGAAASAPG